MENLQEINTFILRQIWLSGHLTWNILLVFCIFYIVNDFVFICFQLQKFCLHFCGGGWLYPVLLSVHLSTFLCNKSVACFWNQFFLSEFIPFDASFNVDLHLFILFGRGRRFWRESEKGGGITPERPNPVRFFSCIHSQIMLILYFLEFLMLLLRRYSNFLRART